MVFEASSSPTQLGVRFRALLGMEEARSGGQRATANEQLQTADRRPYRPNNTMAVWPNEYNGIGL